MRFETLKKNEILKDNICVIGDGKANFIHGIYNLNKVKKIYSVNLVSSIDTRLYNFKILWYN